MVLLKILGTGFIDKMAYGFASLAALWWVAYMKYPAAIPLLLRGTDPLYGIIPAALTGGMLIAKYALLEGYSRPLREAQAESNELAGVVRDMKESLAEIRAERDGMSLQLREGGKVESRLGELRKKIRLHEEEKRSALTFFIGELRAHLNEMESTDEEDISRAVTVLRKEIQLLGNEVKRGKISLYEIIVKVSEIRENIFDLTFVRASQGEGRYGDAPRREFTWFGAETDPSRVERFFKFLKVAFHPDRFPSEGLREEAKVHFQEVMHAYSSFKERMKASQ